MNPSLIAEGLRGRAIVRKVAAAFREGMAIEPTLEERLAATLRHVLSHPGSLIRARIAFELGQVFGLAETTALRLATGLEYMHTASLLLDDMPAMDDARIRRGRPCAHRLYGENACTLAALALINRSYALLWSAMPRNSSRRAAAAKQIERCLGVAGMLDGQSRDLHTGRPWRPRDVLRVSMGKTVAMIRLTMVLPALDGRAEPRQRALLNRLGVYWGLAYQILDDLKDVHVQCGVAGKTTRRDAVLGRPNLAAAEGSAVCLPRLARLLDRSQRTVRELVGSDPRLRLLEFVQCRLRSETDRLGILPTPACA